VYEPVAQRAETDNVERYATPAETGGETAVDTGGEGFALWLREKLDATERELKETRAELSDTMTDLLDTKERLSEHREAARLLEHKSTEQQRLIEETRRQAEEWKRSLSERQAEIEQARVEAEQLGEQIRCEADQKERAEAAARAWESRGLMARIFNRKPTTV
jgi:chromosome segregation ATPase